MKLCLVVVPLLAELTCIESFLPSSAVSTATAATERFFTARRPHLHNKCHSHRRSEQRQQQKVSRLGVSNTSSGPEDGIDRFGRVVRMVGAAVAAAEDNQEQQQQQQQQQKQQQKRKSQQHPSGSARDSVTQVVEKGEGAAVPAAPAPADADVSWSLSEQEQQWRPRQYEADGEQRGPAAEDFLHNWEEEGGGSVDKRGNESLLDVEVVPPAHVLDSLREEEGGTSPVQEQEGEEGGSSQKAAAAAPAAAVGTETEELSGSFIDMFRGSTPYIRVHRGSVMVVHIPGEVLESPSFQPLMDDLALTSLLGVRLVIVVGSRMQTDRLLMRQGMECLYAADYRVTDVDTLRVCKEAAGFVMFEMESALTRGSRGRGRMMGGKDGAINVSTGNMYSARPIGVRNGVDYGYSGEVRRIDSDKIAAKLEEGEVVLLTSLGFSASGELFNVDTEALAADCAAELRASKLIYITEGQRLRRKSSGVPVQCLRTREAERLLKKRWPEKTNNGNCVELTSVPASSMEGPQAFYEARTVSILRNCVRALHRKVSRAHVVPPYSGDLLQELFTREGSGLLISRDVYDGIRPAGKADLKGIRNIIRPLEEEGILVPRPEDKLLQDLKNFFVVTKDDKTLACACLTRYSGGAAEISCLAVDPVHRKRGRGDALLSFCERVAFEAGIAVVFVLSTRTMQWFLEHGYMEVSPDALPGDRVAWDNRRRSKVYMKKLKSSRQMDMEEMMWNL